MPVGKSPLVGKCGFYVKEPDTCNRRTNRQ